MELGPCSWHGEWDQAVHASEQIANGVTERRAREGTLDISNGGRCVLLAYGDSGGCSRHEMGSGSKIF